MKIIVSSKIIREEKDEEEKPFDKELFDAEQRVLSSAYKKRQSHQTKLRNEILEEAIIDFWESIG